jgi:energy-coupling factor transport system permease protein
MITGFKSYHPGINMLYYLMLIFITMTLIDPIVLGFILVAVIVYGIYISGLRLMLKSFQISLPIGIIMIIVNPLINHRGRHILFLLIDKPITLEALLMGIIMAVSLIIIISLFVSYQSVVDYHKFIYVFGKVLPKTAFLTTMTMRFIPLLKRRYKEISFVSNMVRIEDTSILNRVKRMNQKLLILLGWSVESAIITSDSMGARGYGLKKRSSYQQYRWEVRDIIFLAISFLMLAMVIYVQAIGRPGIIVYPNLGLFELSSVDYFLYFAIFIYVNFPLWIQLKEGIRWHYLKSKI